MQTFNVYLGNPHEMKYDWKALVKVVYELMDPVVVASKKYNRLKVVSTTTAPVVADHELLCYVLPGKSSSVIDPSIYGPTKDMLGSDGTTVWRSPGKTVSEVYKRTWKPDTLGKLVYHELMHNKLREGVSLHRRKGLASEVLDADTKQRNKNTKRMAARLHRPQPQWIDGFERIKSARSLLQNLDSHDPLYGL